MARGDPNAKGQEFFTPSSVGWPPFMRVNPVLDWTYGDVWAFLRAVGAPYCSLYDRGFTSVGGIDNTEPNRSVPIVTKGPVVPRIIPLQGPPMWQYTAYTSMDGISNVGWRSARIVMRAPSSVLLQPCPLCVEDCKSP